MEKLNEVELFNAKVSADDIKDCFEKEVKVLAISFYNKDVKIQGVERQNAELVAMKIEVDGEHKLVTSPSPTFVKAAHALEEFEAGIRCMFVKTKVGDKLPFYNIRLV